MPRIEFINLVKEIKKEGKGRKISIREFLWLFHFYEKRTSGNVWRINEYLKKEKMEVIPNFQHGWVDDEIELREKLKIKIKPTDKIDAEDDAFDPISRLSILTAASQTPLAIKKEDNIDKAYHLMWKNDFSQLPVMNDKRNLVGIISWQSIAKGFITKKGSNLVKDYMVQDYTILSHNTPLFSAIKEVIRCGLVFVKESDNTIKGPVTTWDVNEEYIDKIEPYILLEQVENFIRMFLHDKLLLEDILPLLKERNDGKKIESIGDMTFGEYVVIMENENMWQNLNLPFVKSEFVNELHDIRNIRNKIMHFNGEGNEKEDLRQLRVMSNFLQDYHSNC